MAKKAESAAGAARGEATRHVVQGLERGTAPATGPGCLVEVDEQCGRQAQAGAPQSGHGLTARHHISTLCESHSMDGSS